ncbi:SRA stem-loop-interacting RNA-binding protein, mitochondrial [Pipistrellus kuhlii]|uniref:SRA stem-loop-interacting RNA-binding protein, mitochondrial n=1 Tax=Pipistrellus kuhlii TaxID=59472 RepID=A0A7J8B647_PIPKU|nr:SRA stem-loop-interacting RNA-binding protein, mitochondrial [Pipistrellus kuhlii]KAF6393790.1 SRA stem-loop interacting RNA binding protein [Pipistrellus kuhlii]
MAASAARAALALRANTGRPVAFIRKIPWTASSSELREHFAQFGHIRKCILPFDRETGFHKGMGWIYFSSEEELQTALQNDSHVIDGVKLHVQAQRPKVLQDLTSDEE